MKQNDLATGGRDGKFGECYADSAIADRELAAAVDRHKSMYFAEKTTDHLPIDYTEAISGRLRLALDGPASTALAEDYGCMAEDGLLLYDAEPFEDLMGRCEAIANRANAAHE